MTDLIDKKVIQDALIEKISRLNAEGEKSIQTAREFIRFKRYVDGITPISQEKCQLSEETPTNTPTDLISRQDAINVVHKYFVEEIDKTPHGIDEDGYDVYTDMATVNSLLVCNKEISKALKALPSADRPRDRDAISREGLLKSWEELSTRGRTEFDQVIMTIPSLPSADRPKGDIQDAYAEGYKQGRFDESVELTTIVRCRNCKHWNSKTDMTYCDRTVWFGTDANDYCSFAERKDE